MALSDLTNQFFKDVPPWANYYATQRMMATPAQKMQYMQGWQPNVADPNYNVPSAVLQGYGGEMPKPWQKLPQQGINWEDNRGSMGAAWHGSDKTPAGEWLKAPWSSEKEYGYIGELMRQQTLDVIKNIGSK